MKNTKRALFTSIVSLLICFTMLMGTTFAWFTDTATVSVTKIVAGNLKVGLAAKSVSSGALDSDWTDYTDVTNAETPIWNYDLWEPGYTSYKVIKVSNLGNLALEYAIDLISTEAKTGENGERLSDVIDVAYKIVANESDIPATFAREDYKGTDWVSGIPMTSFLQYVDAGIIHGSLLPKGDTADGTGYEYVENVYVIIALHMDEQAGNAYQELKEQFDVRLYAKQYTEEADSFNDQYDKDAEYLNKNNPNGSAPEPEVETATVVVTVTGPDGDIYNHTYTDVAVGTTIDFSNEFTAPANATADKPLSFVVESGMTEYNVEYTKNAPTPATVNAASFTVNIPAMAENIASYTLTDGTDTWTGTYSDGVVSFSNMELSLSESTNLTFNATAPEGVVLTKSSWTVPVNVTVDETNTCVAAVSDVTIETGYTVTVQDATAEDTAFSYNSQWWGQKYHFGVGQFSGEWDRKDVLNGNTGYDFTEAQIASILNSGAADLTMNVKFTSINDEESFDGTAILLLNSTTYEYWYQPNGSTLEGNTDYSKYNYYSDSDTVYITRVGESDKGVQDVTYHLTNIYESKKNEVGIATGVAFNVHIDNPAIMHVSFTVDIPQ